MATMLIFARRAEKAAYAQFLALKGSYYS